ncbi:ankyrin repeat-containing protein-like [Dorcoceras hygrometricum]|uniref:Ankyrin repeat-containing protein-like n=1 Tax=Dorcoceras hygrometricum TaxID=472368 RepID=A0A2Z6ZYC4_9LAMI|nr:ankyrin repeat-containing protein-like [Dorcoceras hygrometricum]
MHRRWPGRRLARIVAHGRAPLCAARGEMIVALAGQRRTSTLGRWSKHPATAGRCTLLECDACGGWSRAMRAGRATLRAASCAAVREFRGGAAGRRRSGDAPTSFRRYRDGWSEFF